MPVHGEVRHLVANAELAVATGVPRERTIVVEDGAVVDLARGKARVVGRLDCGYVFVDGSTVDAVGEAELDDRRVLGEEGFISAIAVVNMHSGQLVEGPILTARGFADGEDIFGDISEEISGALRQALLDGVDDTFQLQQLMRRRIGRWVSRQYRRRPMIVPVVLAT